MNFIAKIQRFMYGRYGPDELYKFLFKIYFLSFIIDLFINSKILIACEFIIVFLMFFRFFSKNIYKRSRENSIYLKYKSIFLKPIESLKRNYKDRNYYKYKKCRNCKTTLRLPLPNSRGIKHAKCPNCKKRITLFCFRKQKIEIIRDGEKIRL